LSFINAHLGASFEMPASRAPQDEVASENENTQPHGEERRVATRLEPCELKKDSLLQTIPSFADLVVIARSLYPIPSRTRPSKSSAPMVLSLKAWKSRSLPGLPRTEFFLITIFRIKSPAVFRGAFLFGRWNCSSRASRGTISRLVSPPWP